MTCARCKADPAPFSTGSDERKCAFPDEQGDASEFFVRNWNCGTMNALREIAEKHSPKWAEGQWCALIPLDADFLVLSWYKSRGCTEGAWIVSSDLINPLTLGRANEIISGAA